MPLANPDDFQFALEEPFYGRLFTRRPDLTNDIRLLIGTNALHALLNTDFMFIYTELKKKTMLLSRATAFLE